MDGKKVYVVFDREGPVIKHGHGNPIWLSKAFAEKYAKTLNVVRGGAYVKTYELVPEKPHRYCAGCPEGD